MKTPGTLRVAWLLSRFSLRRRINRIGSLRRSRKEGRSAVPRKSAHHGLLLLLGFGGLMMLQAFLMSSQAVTRFRLAVAVRDHPALAGDHPAKVDRDWITDGPIGIGGGSAAHPFPDLDANELGAPVLLLLGGTLLVFSVSILFVNLGAANQDLGRVTWSTEWLFSFPVPAKSLFVAKVGEYALTDLFCWIAVFPFLTVVYYRAGFGWISPVAGAAANLAVATVLSSGRLLAETWLRKRLALHRLKNVQAGCTVLGLLLLFATFFLALGPRVPGPVLDAAARLPVAALWFPLSLPVLPAREPWAWLGLAAFAAAAAAGAVAICSRLVRDGLVSASGAAAKGRRGKVASPGREPLLRGVFGKEVRLLLRDRNFFVQTLIVPILVIAFQVLVNPGLFAHGSGLAGVIVAYGVGAYVLMFGAFSVLSVERESLWLLFTFPRSLAQVLRKKAILWAIPAMLYALIVLACSWRPGPSPGARILVAPLLALVGVGILSFLAAGIATLGTDPFEDRPNRRVGPQYVYLYMFLAAIFGYAIWAPSLWLKFVLVVLYVLLAVALWQKAEERLPLLLDPTRSPPRRISLADGMVYTLLFFVLQELAALLYRAAGVEALGHVVLLAYVTAGIGTVLIAASGLPPGAVARIVGHHAGRPFRGRALLAGIGAGLAAAALGLGWIFVIHHVPFLERVAAERARVSIYDGPGTFLALSALAVLAAPVVEEFLFRGIVFRGLARLVGPTLAVVGSSLLFAVVHPAISFPAVFGLGVAAALIYRRTRSLPASMATHMVYNAVVMVAAAAL